MTAGPEPRLTRADERALARLLAEGDDDKVMRLGLAINHYEVTAADAKARLGKRNPATPHDQFWLCGYRAAMDTILEVICEQAGTGASTRFVLDAVMHVAASAGDLAFAESTAATWAEGDASSSGRRRSRPASAPARC